MINPGISTLREVFSFPHPVNEYAARMVSGMVVALAVVIIFLDLPWLMFVLAYGFLARVLTGPSLSPMGLLATRVFAPLFHLQKPVAGPPKRFAQTVGLGFAATALILYYVFDLVIATKVVIGILIFFAAMEAFVGFCTGCFVFGYLMRWGLIPQDVCDRCNNLVLPAPALESSTSNATISR
jgi:hypothetical protein